MESAGAFASAADEAHARQAASGLYYAVAAAILDQEGLKLPRRRALAALVRQHRLEPRDPLQPVEPVFQELLDA